MLTLPIMMGGGGNTGDSTPESPDIRRTDFTPSDLTKIFATEIDKYYDGNVWSLVADINNIDNIVAGDWVPTDVSDENGAVYTYDIEVACVDCYKGECYNNTNPVYDGSGDGSVTKVPSHVDVISKQLYNIPHAWNNSNNNNGSVDQQCPWLCSALYLYLQNTVFPLLPQELRDVAIEKCMLIEQRYSSSSSSLSSPTGECWQSIGKLWIPNEVELYGSVSLASKDYGNYGVQYEMFNDTSSRSLRTPTDSAGIWWSLSPYLNSTSIVRTGTGGGRNNTNASNTYYFPLCVRIELK